MSSDRTRVLIIGAGPGGIAAGVRLKDAGIDDFLIFERAGGVGGTWWRNRYPGLACDIASHLYSFSFALKPDWSRPFAAQPEIQAYMEQCVAEFGLWAHIRLNTAVVAARWDEGAACWQVTTDAGHVSAGAIISSQGMFGALNVPDIEGRDTFAGTAFHSGAWDTEHSLAGERVAVIGSAASAVQLIPEVARVAARLHVFQRSANWVLPKEDTPFTAEKIESFVTDRAALEAHRKELEEEIGAKAPYREENRAPCEAAGLGNLEVVRDPGLRAKLTPTSPFGCKRPLFSNEYYPTFNLPHVELVTEAIARISPAGVIAADGVEREVDTIIYATGYETTQYLMRIDITGRDGRTIRDAWHDGAQAYLGITVAGFPNLFMLYGPNTNHGSILWMIECQVDYVVGMLKCMEREGLTWLDVRPDVMSAYNERLQRDLDAVTVWDAGCHHYYRVPSGRIVTQWPHAMFTYRDLTTAPDPVDAYLVGRRHEGAHLS